MIDTLLNLVFRCAHRRLTRPVTPVVRGDAAHTGTYVVCLDCGKQFSYDAKEMRIGRAIEPSNGAEMAPVDNLSSGSRFKHVLAAAVPAAVVFLLALFGYKREHTKR